MCVRVAVLLMWVVGAVATRTDCNAMAGIMLLLTAAAHCVIVTTAIMMATTTTGVTGRETHTVKDREGVGVGGGCRVNGSELYCKERERGGGDRDAVMACANLKGGSLPVSYKDNRISTRNQF